MNSHNQISKHKSALVVKPEEIAASHVSGVAQQAAIPRSLAISNANSFKGKHEKGKNSIGIPRSTKNNEEGGYLYSSTFDFKIV